jgi:hypothetical protein
VPLGDEEIQEETTDLSRLHGGNIRKLSGISYQLSGVTGGASGSPVNHLDS